MGELDPFIAPYVEILQRCGVETYESCQGGDGHSYPEPTIRFHGTYAAAWHALGHAIDYALPVSALRRVWTISDGEPTGPIWEMVFCPTHNAQWRQYFAEQQLTASGANNSSPRP